MQARIRAVECHVPLDIARIVDEYANFASRRQQTMRTNAKVTALVALRDGRVVVGTNLWTRGWTTREISVWDVDDDGTMTCASRASVHIGDVCCFAEMDDGRVASGHAVGSILLWTIIAGTTSPTWQTLVGEANDGNRPLRPFDASASMGGSVMCLAVLRDGRVASGLASGVASGVCRVANGQLPSKLRTYVRIWDVHARTSVSCGVGARVTRSLTVLANGHLVIASDGGGIRILDVATGKYTSLPTAGYHASVVCYGRKRANVSVDSDSCLPNLNLDLDSDSGSSESDVDSDADGDGLCSVECVLALRDGRLVSAYHDGTIRVWSIEGGECRHVSGDWAMAGNQLTRFHSDRIVALVELNDGRLVSRYKTCSRVWDICTDTVGTGAGRTLPHGPPSYLGVNGPLCAMADGRLVSGADDGLVVWH
jgi:WD40 repeat protein